jgi:hypothetical protein
MQNMDGLCIDDGSHRFMSIYDVARKRTSGRSKYDAVQNRLRRSVMRGRDKLNEVIAMIRMEGFEDISGWRGLGEGEISPLIRISEGLIF